MIETKPLPSLELLQNIFFYDCNSGKIYWKISPHPRIKACSEAGTIRDGYKVIGLFGSIYLAHRLCWFLHYKKDPGNLLIDHIDRNRSNNKIVNLRLVTVSENQQNIGAPKNNKLGELGVFYDKQRGKFRGRIYINGKLKHLGYFNTIEKAIEARKKAEIRYWL